MSADFTKKRILVRVYLPSDAISKFLYPCVFNGYSGTLFIRGDGFNIAYVLRLPIHPTGKPSILIAMQEHFHNSLVFARARRRRAKNAPGRREAHLKTDGAVHRQHHDRGSPCFEFAVSLLHFSIRIPLPPAVDGV